MKSITLIGAGLAAAVAAGASANVTSLQVEYGGTQTVSGQVRHVWNVFAVTSNNANVLLNIVGHTVTDGSMSGVQHSDFSTAEEGPGTWNPLSTSNTNSVRDSFVTIAGVHGSAANTSLDPSFSPDEGSTIPTGAGWFAANPTAAPVFTNGRIKIMQVVGATYTNAAGGAFYTASLVVGYKANANSTTPLFSNTLTYTVGIPAPGAVALLGLAGLAGRRRRA